MAKMEFYQPSWLWRKVKALFMNASFSEHLIWLILPNNIYRIQTKIFVWTRTIASGHSCMYCTLCFRIENNRWFLATAHVVTISSKDWLEHWCWAWLDMLAGGSFVFCCYAFQCPKGYCYVCSTLVFIFFDISGTLRFVCLLRPFWLYYQRTQKLVDYAWRFFIYFINLLQYMHFLAGWSNVLMVPVVSDASDYSFCKTNYACGLQSNAPTFCFYSTTCFHTGTSCCWRRDFCVLLSHHLIGLASRDRLTVMTALHCGSSNGCSFA